ncbi:hypothetical protein LXA43DRAFT_988141 [Ganoderma leucocontextum]|nr:hypothetical protein LXA43DRAFT_237769 [Ganoderma leucocontextum]KAI1796057.1 hypothetical protein LXA43DRAFT_988141 [Ganoderma leucocontextum]
MPEPLVTLEEADATYLGPFYAINALIITPGFTFAPCDRDGSRSRRICCIQHRKVATGELLPKRPLLFDIVGQISPDQCFLTARGLSQPSDPADEEPVASCWLEPRTHIMSEINWRGVEDSVGKIVQAIPGDVDTSRLFARDEGGRPKLQVIWQGYSGETTAATLPMFDAEGYHRVPAAISEVPFGMAMHASFSIEYYFCRQTGTRIVFANLVRIVYA